MTATTATTARKLSFSARRSTHRPSVGGKTAFAIFTNDNRESAIVFPFSKCTGALEFAKAGNDLEWQAPIKAVKKPYTGGFITQENKAMDAIHASEVAAKPVHPQFQAPEIDADHNLAPAQSTPERQARVQTLEESHFEDEDALVASLSEINY